MSVYDARALGRNIRAARKRLHMTQTQLGDKLYVSQQTVSFWETARIAPRPEYLTEIARVLGVTVESLTGNGRNGT